MQSIHRHFCESEAGRDEDDSDRGVFGSEVGEAERAA